ncbi:MAG TPA: phosphate ABC transporter permease PstC, partial [Xanthobacteraceae bacterium]|nr:phosphate ABC transporter permease PstC [Xanthobacteraceae bacterium]
MTLQAEMLVSAVHSPRMKALNRFRLGDALFRSLTRAAAIAVLVILGSVILALVEGAWPALRTFGLNFLIEQRWNPVTDQFGA